MIWQCVVVVWEKLEDFSDVFIRAVRGGGLSLESQSLPSFKEGVGNQFLTLSNSYRLLFPITAIIKSERGQHFLFWGRFVQCVVVARWKGEYITLIVNLLNSSFSSTLKEFVYRWFGSIEHISHCENVNIADLTKEQREAIQPGNPTPAKDGERTLLVYAYDKNACQLAPVLPEIGTGSQALMMVAGSVALTGAAYFLVSNKNGKKIVLMAGLVLSGTVAATLVVSANETLADDSCYKYVGFLRESGETTNRVYYNNRNNNYNYIRSFQCRC